MSDPLEPAASTVSASATATTDAAPAPVVRRRGSTHDAAWYSIARLLAAGFTTMTTLVVAGVLAKGDYGVYATLVGLAGFTAVAADFGLTSSTATFIARGAADGTTVRRVMRLKAVACLVFAGLFVLGATIAGYVGHSPHLRSFAPFVGLVVVGQMLTAVGYGLLPSLGRFRLLAVTGIGQALAELGLVALLALGHQSAQTFLLASFATSLVAGGIAITGAIRTPIQGTDSGLRPLVRYGVPLFAITVTLTAFGVLDPLVLGATRSAAEAAPYLLAFKVIALASIPALGAAAAVSPRVAGGGPVAAGLLTRWTGLVLAAYAGIAVVLGLVAIPGLRLLGGSYGGDGWVLAALSGYVLLTGVATLTSTATNYLGGGRKRLPIGFGVLAANVALDLLLIPRWGAAGAAVSTTACYCWYTLAHARLAWRLLQVELPFARLAAATGGVLAVAGGAITGGCLLESSNLSWPLVAALVVVIGLAALAAITAITAVGMRLSLAGLRRIDGVPHPAATAPPHDPALAVDPTRGDPDPDSFDLPDTRSA